MSLEISRIEKYIMAFGLVHEFRDGVIISVFNKDII